MQVNPLVSSGHKRARIAKMQVNPLVSSGHKSARIAKMQVNPLVPSGHNSARITKISIVKLEGIIEKNSYERRDYESVDEKSLS